jgi:CheY-like chemotaxis protein
VRNAAHAHQSVIRFPTPAPVKLGKLTILLAEDNAMIRWLAESLLRGRGHAVAVAADGEEALAALEHGPFDVVLMDAHMPLLSGYEVAEEIRLRERYTGGRTRIVGMAPQSSPGARERCLAAGMDACMVTPFVPAMLYAAVEQDAFAARADLAARVVADPVDTEEMLHRLCDDEGLFVQVSLLFLDDCPKTVAEIDAAIAGADHDRVRFLAHTLKGTAGNISARLLYETAARLERFAVRGDHDNAAVAARAVAVEIARVAECLRDAVVEAAARASGSTARSLRA